MKIAGIMLDTNNMLLHAFTYKGHIGSIETLSAEDNKFFGKLLMIPTLIIYESKTKEGLLLEFKAAVDEYLQKK